MSIEVLLIQNILPPYRYPFFQKLAISPLFNITFAYDSNNSADCNENISEPDDLKFITLRNLYFGRSQIAVFQKGLLHLIGSRKYNIIIAEFNPRIISNIIACLYAKILGIRFIWWGQGFGPRVNRVRMLLRLWLARIADALIFYDQVQANKFIFAGLPQEKVFIAPNSLDIDRILPLAKEWSEGKRNRILYIGRLNQRKKVDLLISSFAQIHSQLDHNVRLAIIGDGPEKPKLQSITRQYGIDEKVDFPGAIYDLERLAPWFNSAWVSVSPGCVGLSAIHSLAFGLPMIVAREEAHGPEVAAIRERVNALFFPTNNIEALSDHLIYLAKNDKMCQKMAKQASATIKGRYSLVSMVNAFEDAIKFTIEPKTK